MTGIAEAGCFTVTAPETLAGTAYRLTEKGVFVSREGITLPAPEKAWPAVLLRFLAAGLPEQGEANGVPYTYSSESGVLSFADCRASLAPQPLTFSE